MHRPGGGVTLGLPVNGSDVDLTAEPQFPHRTVLLVGVGGDGGLSGGDVDGVAQLLNRDRQRGRWVAVAGSVEADEGVEVDDAAALELGHLRKRHREVVPQLRTRDAEEVGEAAAEVMVNRRHSSGA